MTTAGLILKTILLLALAAAAEIDFKTRTIPVFIPAAGFISGIILQIILGQSFLFQASGAAVGLLLLAISLLSRQALGMGDAFLFIMTGIFLGALKNLFLLLLSLTLAAIAGVTLLIKNRKKGRQSLPFSPFIFTGYILILLFTGI